jgi:transcriptional regulator with XRE-family HTH domain
MPTTSTSKLDVQPIEERELLDYRADVKGRLFRQIRKRFRQLQSEHGFSQAHLAKRLRLDTGLLSRRLKGDNDMRLETLSDLARGLDCRIDVRLTPLTDIVSLDLGGLPFRAITTTTIEQVPGTERPTAEPQAVAG